MKSVVRIIPFVFAASLLGGAKARANHYYAPQGSNYCLEHWLFNFGSISSYSPDCEQFSHCSAIDVTPGDQPANCGRTYFNENSTDVKDVVLNSAQGDVYVDLESREIWGKSVCNVVAATPVSCVGERIPVTAFTDVTEKHQDGSTAVRQTPVQTFGRMFTQITPTRWKRSEQLFENGAKAATRVIFRLKDIDYPAPYKFTMRVSWAKDNQAKVTTLESAHFSHSATLISANPTTQEFEITSVIKPIASSAAIANGVSLETGDLSIDDANIQSLLSLAPEMKTHYQVRVQVIERKILWFDKDLGTVFVGEVENTDGRALTKLNINENLLNNFKFNPKSKYEVRVKVSTTRLNNKYISPEPVTSDEKFILKAK